LQGKKRFYASDLLVKAGYARRLAAHSLRSASSQDKRTSPAPTPAPPTSSTNDLLGHQNQHVLHWLDQVEVVKKGTDEANYSASAKQKDLCSFHTSPKSKERDSAEKEDEVHPFRPSKMALRGEAMAQREVREARATTTQPAAAEWPPIDWSPCVPANAHTSIDDEDEVINVTGKMAMLAKTMEDNDDDGDHAGADNPRRSWKRRGQSAKSGDDEEGEGVDQGGAERLRGYQGGEQHPSRVGTMDESDLLPEFRSQSDQPFLEASSRVQTQQEQQQEQQVIKQTSAHDEKLMKRDLGVKLISRNSPSDMPSLAVVEDVTDNVEIVAPDVRWSASALAITLKIRLTGFKEAANVKRFIVVDHDYLQAQFLAVEPQESGRERYLVASLPKLEVPPHTFKPQDTIVDARGFSVSIVVKKAIEGGSGERPFVRDYPWLRADCSFSETDSVSPDECFLPTPDAALGHKRLRHILETEEEIPVIPGGNEPLPEAYFDTPSNSAGYPEDYYENQPRAGQEEDDDQVYFRP